jgi:hypothetical protein
VITSGSYFASSGLNIPVRILTRIFLHSDCSSFPSRLRMPYTHVPLTFLA